MVRAGTHPDLIEVRKPDDKSELPISLIQDLTGQLSLKPACGTRKVAIVDNADDLNEESANGFLKTLEEPPPGSLLILIARSQESQLPTIQSRCQIARFLPLKDDDVASILVALGKVASFDEALPWARAGQGSVSEAIECARPEWVEMVRQMAESLGEQPMNSPRLSSRVLAFIDEAGKESSAKRDRARRLAQRVARLLHDTLCVQSGGGGESLLPADRWDADLLAEMIDRTLDADYHVQRMASFSLVVETWLDDLARLMEGRRLEPIY
jgi:DNA polymerase-3 subunit delta'